MHPGKIFSFSRVFMVFAFEHGNYTGIFNLRHCLNEFLANGLGHIGYGIAPEYRKKGYATKGLALVLEEAKKLGIEEAYFSANRDNIGSVKAQLNNGAVIHKETEEKIYTRIAIEILKNNIYG